MVSIDRQRVREALTGPVASVGTPFQRDGSIDFGALRQFVDFAIAAGSGSLILTYGDSLYSILSDQEVAEVTKVTVKQAAGRALVIAAGRIWATPQELAFARYARGVGADVLMVLPPDWANSCTVETLVEHYAAVAAEIPVMVVTNLYARRPMAQGLQVLEMLRDKVDNVVAIKDDVVGEFARRMGLLLHEKWAIISGGQKQNHLNALPYGCDGYFSTFIKFKPSIAWDYWKAVRAQDWPRVREIIREYDMPYFDLVAGLPGNFDAGLHATLELFGIGSRWRRKPYYSLSDAEMEKLADFFRALKLL